MISSLNKICIKIIVEIEEIIWRKNFNLKLRFLKSSSNPIKKYVNEKLINITSKLIDIFFSNKKSKTKKNNTDKNIEIPPLLGLGLLCWPLSLGWSIKILFANDIDLTYLTNIKERRKGINSFKINNFLI